MGWMCGECKTWQAQKRVEDVDGNPPKTAEEVFLITLMCGHKVGAEQASAFLKATSAIKNDYASRKAALEKELSQKLAAAWEGFRG